MTSDALTPFCCITALHVQAIERAVAEEGWKVVLMLRLSPAFPFTAVNYAAGLTCISFWDFMGASAVGLIPGGHLFALASHCDVRQSIALKGSAQTEHIIALHFRPGMLTTEGTVWE